MLDGAIELLPPAKLVKLVSRYLKKAGIRLIEYPNPDGKHSKLPEVLEWLAS